MPMRLPKMSLISYVDHGRGDTSEPWNVLLPGSVELSELPLVDHFVLRCVQRVGH